MYILFYYCLICLECDFIAFGREDMRGFIIIIIISCFITVVNDIE